MLAARMARTRYPALAGLLVALVLALPAHFVAGSRASAQEPAMIVFGFVERELNRPFPTRVRAFVGDTVCGTADVAPSGEGLAFYFVIVASEAQKPGCGTEGATVTFRLLYASLDAGTPFAQSVPWRRGVAQRLDLSPQTGAALGSFVGTLPSTSGFGIVRWTGRSGTPVEHAVATIPRAVAAVFYWDVVRQRFDVYIPGGPALTSTYTVVDTDDVVIVRLH